jgi:hypothetical protein
MMVNNRLLAVALAAGALGSAASAVGAPATHLGLPLPALHVSHGRAGSTFAQHEASRYQRYGYGYYGGYAYDPYAAQDVAAQPPYAEAAQASAPSAAATAYNGDKVCPAAWRWSARAGQAVRSWSYCND